jgi:hypothetical protein
MKPGTRHHVEQEAERCARALFYELTGGHPRQELWYRWYLCERHGGPPLLDPKMHPRQIAYWDGEDIVIAPKAPLEEIAAALPEELAHRLTSPETPRCEPMNHTLRYAHTVSREMFHEMVGQRVAALFEAVIPRHSEDGTGREGR